jgi:prepilin-type processing-associated H-X9-DG protein/prepilin-type N-terminal cleavage/methylation domain-containing protein
MKNKKMRKFRAFTLTELLVVITVIAILMAVLMPSLRRAREVAQRVVCGNNQKNLQTANDTYASTFGIYTPLSYHDPFLGQEDPDTNGYVRWITNEAFRKYMELDVRADVDNEGWIQPKELMCPTDTITPKEGTQYNVQWSYGYNSTDWGWTNIEGENLTAAHKPGDVKNAADKIVFADAIDWWIDWPDAAYVEAWDKLGQARQQEYRALTPEIWAPVIYRHNEGANFAFYDGHVEYLKKTDAFSYEDFNADPKRPGMWVVDKDMFAKRDISWVERPGE